MTQKWMLLSYTLPAEPSSKRVLVWRHLRKLGAMLDAGVWLLPGSTNLEVEFRKALAEIEELGGRPLAFYAEDLTGRQHDDLKTAFNQMRSEEYVELIHKCERFLAHVQRWTESGEFGFEAIEELEEDLEKRRRSLAQITSRDVFEVTERGQAERSLKDCQAALARFTEAAYTATNESPVSGGTKQAQYE